MSRVFFEAYVKATKELAAQEDRFPSLSEIDAQMESGAVYELFAQPRHEYTRQLVSRTLNLELPPRLLEGQTGRILKLHYLGSRAEEPVISATVRRFQVQVNILHGRIEYIGGHPLRVLIVAVDGPAEQVDGAVAYIGINTAAVEVMQ